MNYPCHNCIFQNYKLFSCEECKSSFCYQCIQELIFTRSISLRNPNKKEILLCKICISNKKYNEYTNKYCQEILDDIENGNLIQCDFCLHVWDGCAQCNCIESDEYNEELNNQNDHNYKLDNILPFIQKSYKKLTSSISLHNETSSFTYLPSQNAKNQKLNSQNIAFFNFQQSV